MPLISIGRSTSLVSEAADGAALPSKFLGIGASDGSLFQALIVESASNPNLRVSLYSGAVSLIFSNMATDGISHNLASLPARGFTYEYNGATWDRVRHSFSAQAAAINANGAGDVLDISTTPMSRFTIQVFRTSGTAECIVELQGSIDNTNWLPLGELTFNATSGMLHIVNKPVKYLRHNVTTIGASNIVTITLLASER